MDSVLKSYKLHEGEFKSQSEDDDRKPIFKSWFDSSTIDYWRHKRSYDIGRLLKNYCLDWLTVGDGRFGLDSIRLLEKGVRSVHPTNLDVSLLETAKSQNLITTFSKENAEALTFEDESFDAVFCKESYHHFPRPYLALYEMIRVSKKVVFLSEPNDFTGSWISKIKLRIKKIIGKGHHPDKFNYEESGNYVYFMSKREVEKVCLGMNLFGIAYKNFNDYYQKGVEFRPAKGLGFLGFRLRIILKDVLSLIGLKKWDKLMILILKEDPGTDILEKLKSSNWRTIVLPRNPHLS